MFRRAKLSQANTDELLELLAATSRVNGTSDPPFVSRRHMFETIDRTEVGDVCWEKMTLQCASASDMEVNNRDSAPSWMQDKHEVWFRNPLSVIRNMLSNPSFDGSLDYVPFREYGPNGRRWQNFMSGDWAWRQAVSRLVRCIQVRVDGDLHLELMQDKISRDERLSGCLFVPTIVGSDKTCVSVATGQNDFYPLYLSIGNVSNDARCKHGAGLVLIGFLAIPKST